MRRVVFSLQCAKQPACLGLNTERPVNRMGPALFVPWSDAPGLSAHTLIIRSVGQEGGSPQWRVVHEHTRRPMPVFMNTKKNNSNFADRPGHVGADHQHLDNTRQLPSTGRSMDGRCSTAKVDFGLLTPNFPLFMNKQRRLLRALVVLGVRRFAIATTPRRAPCTATDVTPRWCCVELFRLSSRFTAASHRLVRRVR